MTLGSWLPNQNQLFKKFSQRATIFAFIFRHFLGGPWKRVQTNANSFQVMPTDVRGPGKVNFGHFQLFLGRFQPFSHVFSRIVAENRHILIFLIWKMSNMTRGKIQRGNTVRVLMLSRGPLVRSSGETALQNLKFETSWSRGPFQPKYWAYELHCAPIAAFSGANAALC